MLTIHGCQEEGIKPVQESKQPVQWNKVCESEKSRHQQLEQTKLSKASKQTTRITPSNAMAPRTLNRHRKWSIEAPISTNDGASY